MERELERESVLGRGSRYRGAGPRHGAGLRGRPGRLGDDDRPTVFEQGVGDDGIGAALRGLSTLDMEGSDHQSAVLPPLDVDKHYRIEAEMHCSTRVVFSVVGTRCGFANILGGVMAESWSVRFDNIIPENG
jgi:hypothetical protein